MKIILKLVLAFFLFSANPTVGQNDTNNWSGNSHYNRMYDEKTFIQINGEVSSIEQIVPKKGISSGVHIQIKTKKGIYPVHLGPKWYLDKQAIQLKVGDKVEVKGSMVNIESKQTIIAKEVIKDNGILKLRDHSGKPVWSGKGNK